MKSLREEIEEWMLERFEDWKGKDFSYDIDTSRYFTEMVLSKMERRIDEHLEKLMNSYIRETVPPMAEMRRSGIIDGVKGVKEMLK